MTEPQFRKLLEFVRPPIERSNTNMRECISAEERLAVTLRYLATGETYDSLHTQFRISTQSISKIIPEVCAALFETLKGIYLATACSEKEWKKVAGQFEEAWNFPHCMGAVDGKHVRIIPPAYAGSHFYNYKGFNSFVLMALVGADYRFIYIDVGTNGRVSDGGVWNKTNLCSQFEDSDNPLNVPAAENVTGCEEKIPYVIVADDAFALKPHLLKPYPAAGLTFEKRIFNYRLSRARRVSENAFGILTRQWGIYRSAINLNLENAKLACLATCALHNFLIVEGNVYSNQVDVEDAQTGVVVEGDWRREEPGSGTGNLRICTANRSKTSARRIRDDLCQFFNCPGAIPFQWERAHHH